MSHAIVIHKFGGPEQLRFEAVDVPEPGPEEVRIRHGAIGVNFIDTYHRTGLYPVPLPSGIGMEAAGEIEAIGVKVREAFPELSVGTRVAYASRPLGAYAQVRNIPADVVVPLPAEVDDETAAAALLKGMTAEYLVRRTFAVSEGDVVLLHAAAGGVGSILVQWLVWLGATVIGTVGTRAKAERARALGCHHVLVQDEEDFVARTRELTAGRGVAVVYDAVGKTTVPRSLQCLARRGTLVCFGNASGPPDPLDILELSRRGSLYVTRPTLMDYTHTRAELVQSATAVFDVLARGAITVDVGQRWPLHEAGAAHRALEARQTVGATILVP